MNAAKVISVVLILACIVLTNAGPVVDDSKGHMANSVHANEPTIEEDLTKKMNTKCANGDIIACTMLKVVAYFDRMLKKSSIHFGDVEITQTSTETIVTDTSRSFNDDNLSDEEQLGRLLTDKIYSFVKTRSLKWKVTDSADLVFSGNSDKDGGLNFGLSLRPTKSTDGDARKKKDNGMGAIIAAAIMKIGLLKALAFKALVLLVGKALLVSKLALVLAAIIGLKKLLHQEKHVTYEVVAHPHHEHEHHSVSSGGHDSWGRNFDAQNLAYRGQIPKN